MSHANQRAEERLGFHLSANERREVIQKIRAWTTSGARYLNRDPRDPRGPVEEWSVPFVGGPIRVLWNPENQCIVTVLGRTPRGTCLGDLLPTKVVA